MSVTSYMVKNFDFCYVGVIDLMNHNAAIFHLFHAEDSRVGVFPESFKLQLTLIGQTYDNYL